MVKLSLLAIGTMSLAIIAFNFSVFPPREPVATTLAAIALAISIVEFVKRLRKPNA